MNHTVAGTGSNDQRLAGLDGLRAVACLAVFLVHFQQITGLDPAWGPVELGRFMANGNTGVALLFILSGWGLSLPLWSGQVSSHPGAWLGQYLRRRVWRIVPAYYFCLTLLVVYQRTWQDEAGRTDLALHYLFAHTLREHTFYSINNPFWTIGIQAQFYLVLPLILLGLAGVCRGWGARMAALTGLIAASYVAQALVMDRGDGWFERAGWGPLVSQSPTVFSHSLLAHLPLFLLGILAGGLSWAMTGATAGQDRGRRSGVALAADVLTWLAGSAVVAIIATPLDDRLQLPHGRYNAPYVPLLLMLTVVAVPFSRSARAILDSPPARWLGGISYGVYLFHLPCQRLVERLLEGRGYEAGALWGVFGLASLVLSIAVAAASYWLVERPLLTWCGGRSLAAKAISGKPAEAGIVA